MEYLLSYLLIINILGFAVTVYDKLSARKKYQRVSERGLLFLAFLGAATSMFFTMLLIRHKTLKRKFMFGLPLIICLHLLALSGVWLYIA